MGGCKGGSKAQAERQYRKTKCCMLFYKQLK